MPNPPVYLEAYSSGYLDKVAGALFDMLGSCAICPRKCRVNRLKGEKGFCKTGEKAKLYSYMAHQGEEPPISGSFGSGTIFFANCNMGCLYCQNYEFSQLGQGKEIDPETLAKIMIELQDMRCHNINLVSPTHVLPQVLKALGIAVAKGLSIPLVYNTGGYELPEIINMLRGIVDVYLPDMRYGDESQAVKYSSAPGYPEYNQAAVRQMHNQAGIAQIDNEGIINKGLIIRHIVLPNNISGTEKVMKFIANELSREVYISLMSQYLPYYKANEFESLSRRLSEREYEQAKRILEDYGLSNGWVQESYGLERFAGVHIKPVLRKDP